MNHPVERRAAPTQRGAAGTAPALVDLMVEGFYALFLLKNGCGPQDQGGFADRMTSFLGDVDRSAKALGIPADDVTAAKYAFCAAVDEIILGSDYAIREAWETRPLQLRLFGDQLAGEHFFQRLEDLRAKGSAHLQALEVYHLCLLLGFQGRFALDGRDKLNYLTARLGDEIARMRGKSRAFAPHAERPDQIVHKLGSDTSLWVLCGVFALAGLGAYLGYRSALGHETDRALVSYNDLIKLPPRSANVTITLP
ncbi:type IVB secretion system protein IcmH/DotU [Massilia putida]|uniref:type IVB secretion system protein IcmH/DotU n=1 Tax=Massilia putida TaxID=1141883 RepID=UPI000952F5E5|nr:type IVB secretion system protein IcmH/DotU [Massilia putida]